MKKTIRLVFITQLLILASYFISFNFYINLQIAFLSSFFIMIGSMYAYKKMVQTHIESETINEDRELLDKIEDPYELYEEDVNDDEEQKDLKTIVKEEKKKIKTLSLSSMKHGTKGSVSLSRLTPYLFLVLGFIALNNNKILDIKVYLPSLLVGVIIGYIVSRDIFSSAK